ncbi:putative glutamyl-tRNA(Gln) amidotransferase subunit A, chloroplastic/mitochondrial [Apostichopus japonicus]|uniref:Putative glutamyl-tRNA(Gln) amidotransferase subunit A, chloroplastic/mitochondrial n=1 Tax=Stichopus japonicus TaxID=307972 RepID=A0A2G8JMD1_STIJA|nr:putative glutamyl-tRNA(Gln) amidotransferase subunit A, chloroplastic/mitochondrial [Apostichopus japonicus]
MQVASGAVDLAIGGDQGGSIRIPAAWCGIVGLKPTFGLVPYTGAMSMDPSLDHLGPMAKTVHDCALLLEVLAGYDNGLDPRQPSILPCHEYSKEGPISIGAPSCSLLCHTMGFEDCLVSEGFSWPNSDTRVNYVVRKAIKTLGRAGAEVEEVSIPMLKYSK